MRLLMYNREAPKEDWCAPVSMQWWVFSPTMLLLVLCYLFIFYCFFFFPIESDKVKRSSLHTTHVTHVIPTGASCTRA